MRRPIRADRPQTRNPHNHVSTRKIYRNTGRWLLFPRHLDTAFGKIAKRLAGIPYLMQACEPHDGVMTANTSPRDTLSPTSNGSDRTAPATGAGREFSIFIASNTKTVCPA